MELNKTFLYSDNIEQDITEMIEDEVMKTRYSWALAMMGVIIIFSCLLFDRQNKINVLEKDLKAVNFIIKK